MNFLFKVLHILRICSHRSLFTRLLNNERCSTKHRHFYYLQRTFGSLYKNRQFCRFFLHLHSLAESRKLFIFHCSGSEQIIQARLYTLIMKQAIFHHGWENLAHHWNQMLTHDKIFNCATRRISSLSTHWRNEQNSTAEAGIAEKRETTEYDERELPSASSGVVAAQGVHVCLHGLQSDSVCAPVAVALHEGVLELLLHGPRDLLVVPAACALHKKGDQATKGTVDRTAARWITRWRTIFFFCTKLVDVYWV